MPSMLSLHGKTAVIALLPLLVWGAIRATMDTRQRGVLDNIEMGVEHTGAAKVHLTRNVGGTVLIADIANEGTETIYVSLPDSWERGEVRNVPLAALTADSPELGYRRWTLPAGAMVTFKPARDWRGLTVHNAGTSLLQMNITTIDLQSGSTDTNVYLVTDSPLSLQL